MALIGQRKQGFGDTLVGLCAYAHVFAILGAGLGNQRSKIVRRKSGCFTFWQGISNKLVKASSHIKPVLWQRVDGVTVAGQNIVAGLANILQAVDQRSVQIKQKNKVLYQIVLDQTPFYAEMGGQVGDTGWLIADDEKIDVIDTKRENNLPVHLVTKLPKDVTATFTAKINVKKRIQCECNHSATHLLHEALREVLGTHVEQKGSYVSPDSLRFDFSHFQKVTDEEDRKSVV